MAPEMPAMDVKKHPTRPTRMMVLEDGVFPASVMIDFLRGKNTV